MKHIIMTLAGARAADLIIWEMFFCRKREDKHYSSPLRSKEQITTITIIMKTK